MAHWFLTDAPVILTCALTGGVHGKEANPHLPEQPDEIVAQGVAAARAGAAILHLHAREPDGSNTMAPAIYREIHDRLCAGTDAIIQLTTGGSPTLPVAERLNTVYVAPEMCSLNMGMMDFFIRGEAIHFSNRRADILRFATEMAARGVRPELEVYNAVMLEEVDFLLRQGILSPPYVVNFVLHTPTQGGSRGTPENLMDMVGRLRDLPVPPGDLRVNVSSMGRTQLPITAMAMAMGLNVRVGMEDNVFYRYREPLTENAPLVARAARIAAELDRRVATPAEARGMLALRGRAFGELPVESPAFAVPVPT